MLKRKKSPLTTARDKNRIQFVDAKCNLIEITQFQHQVAISILFEKRRQSSRRQSQLCCWPNLLPPAETWDVLGCKHKTEIPNLSQGGWEGLEGSCISLPSSNKNLQLREAGNIHYRTPHANHSHLCLLGSFHFRLQSNLARQSSCRIGTKKHFRLFHTGMLSSPDSRPVYRVVDVSFPLSTHVILALGRLKQEDRTRGSRPVWVQSETEKRGKGREDQGDGRGGER